MTPLDARLLARVRSHAVDLDAELVEVDEPALEPSLSEQLSTGAAYGSRYRAGAVVWFQMAPGDTLLLYLLTPGNGRLFVRQLAAPPQVRSAVSEEAALIVRAALRSIAAGGVIGIVPQIPSAPTPPPEPSAPPPAPDVPPPTVAPPRPPPRPAPTVVPPAPPSKEPPSSRWVATWGWGVVLDGAHAEQGPTLRLGLESSSWELGLSLRRALPNDTVDPQATVRLQASALAVDGGLALLRTPHLRLSARLQLGAASFERTTVATAPEVQPAPARTLVSPLTGARAHASYRIPIARGVALGLGAEVGFDLVPLPPRIGFSIPPAEGLVGARQLWLFQPAGLVAFDLIAPFL